MPIDVIRINTKLPLNCFKATSGDWIAVCQSLGITVQAETWSELMEDIGYTLDAMFQELLISNELETFLRDHGWEAAGQIPTQPDRAVRFDAPFIPALVGTPA